MITTFGSCRVLLLNLGCETTNICNLTTYPHTTKEIIQLIKFLNGDLEIPYPYNIYCFRSAIISRDPEFPHEHTEINWNYDLKKLLDSTDKFVIEISSNKIYEHNGYYLHHITVDGRGQDIKYANLTKQNHPEIAEHTLIRYQTAEEILKDILQIREMLDKPITIVSHFDAKVNGLYLQRRHWLVEALEHICFVNGIAFFDPAWELSPEYEQEEIIQPDLTHYTDFGNEIISKNLYENCISK